MPIEFECENCPTVLRTPSGTAGKSARCPGCGNVQPIPASQGRLGAVDVPTAVALGGPVEQKPFAKQTYDVGPAGNPYASGRMPGRSAIDAATARSRVQPAAITWLVCMIVLSLLFLLGAIGGFAEMAAQGAAVEDIGIMIVLFAGLSLCLFGIAGAICMLRMGNRKLAIAAAIGSMLPGLMCCFLPMGASIWALVVLLDGEVRPYFS